MTDENLTHLLICLQSRLDTIINQLDTIIEQKYKKPLPPFITDGEGNITAAW